MRCQTQWVQDGIIQPDYPEVSFCVLNLLLLCSGPTFQVRVGGDITNTQLVKLLPNTAYTVSVIALHGESASEPLTDQGVTST